MKYLILLLLSSNCFSQYVTYSPIGDQVKNQKAQIFLSASQEMTASGGQVYDEFYWLNTNNASVTKSSLHFPASTSYRVDISAYKVAGSPQVSVIVDGVNKGTIAITTTTIGIFSLFVNSSIASGNTHSLTIQLSNFSSGTNHCRIGLVYMTSTTQTTPYTYPVIRTIPLISGQVLKKNHFASHHLRGFNLGSNGTNQPSEKDTSMRAMVATGANIARCFVEIERPSGDTYQFKSGELEKLDTTVARATRLGFYVVPVMFHDPSLNSDYWGTTSSHIARRLSMANLWKTLAVKYVGNPVIAAYDLINEPRSNFNYAEVIRWEEQLIDTIKTVDKNHVCVVECISNDMFAMMLPLAKENIVYSPHGYSPINITHQGVVGESGANIRNKYPHYAATSNQDTFTIYSLSKQHDDVRTMANRFHVPIFVGEFSCVNWSPINDNNYPSSTKWIEDDISLLEKEGWSWVYHNFSHGGEAIEWDPEIPPSFYVGKTFTGATPDIKATKNNETVFSPTLLKLKEYFNLNYLP